MAEVKTKPTKHSATTFLKTIEPQTKQKDSVILLELFQKVTKEKPVMWGSSIIGFGKYHYQSEKSTQHGDWPLVAFSPRKQNLTLYILHGNTNASAFAKLGKYTTSSGMGGCLYIKKLADIDLKVLEALIKTSFEYMKKTKTS